MVEWKELFKNFIRGNCIMEYIHMCTILEFIWIL